jgi:hypothetical protein
MLSTTKTVSSGIVGLNYRLTDQFITFNKDEENPVVLNEKYDLMVIKAMDFILSEDSSEVLWRDYQSAPFNIRDYNKELLNKFCRKVENSRKMFRDKYTRVKYESPKLESFEDWD